MGEKELSRKEREHLARRSEILQAALRLFSQKGYTQTTMNEIAKEAEFSVGSLYSFFQNKEELFFNLIMENIEEIGRDAGAAMSAAATPKAKLDALANALFDYFEKHWQAFNIAILNRQSFDGNFKNNIGEFIHHKQEEFQRLLTDIIGEGIAAGEFKGFRPEEMALAFMGLINGSIFLWIDSGRPYSLKERAQGILNIFYQGVLKS
jgi:TetR/AcrR family transcriptional regulator